MALLLSCDAGPAAAGGQRQLADYAGVLGARIELAPAETPDDPPLSLTLGADTWEARIGEDWESAVPVATWSVSAGEALTVGEVVLLEMPLPTVATVVTYYGTFTEAVTVEVADPPFAGEWSFGENLGPIVVTLDGIRRECVMYERGVIEDSGG